MPVTVAELVLETVRVREAVPVTVDVTDGAAEADGDVVDDEDSETEGDPDQEVDADSVGVLVGEDDEVEEAVAEVDVE